MKTEIYLGNGAFVKERSRVVRMWRTVSRCAFGYHDWRPVAMINHQAICLDCQQTRLDNIAFWMEQIEKTREVAISMASTEVLEAELKKRRPDGEIHMSIHIHSNRRYEGVVIKPGDISQRGG